MDPLTGKLGPNRTNKEVREGVPKPSPEAPEPPVMAEGKESATGATA